MAPVHPVYDCIRRTCATSRSGPLVPPKRCCCLMKAIVYASPGPAHPIWVAAPHNTGHEELHTLRGQAPAAAVSRSAFTKILDIRLQVTLSKTIQGVDAKLNAKGLATRLSLSLPGQRAESDAPLNTPDEEMPFSGASVPSADAREPPSAVRRPFKDGRLGPTLQIASESLHLSHPSWWRLD